MAPEIIRVRAYKEFQGELNFDFNPYIADVWALGCCLFELVTARLPFNASDDHEMLRLQQNGLYSYPCNWQVSNNCRDLISKMLDPVPESRVDPFGIEQHPWLVDNGS